MSVQTVTLKIDGITAGDYLTWCRDPDPPALDHGLRSIGIEADPLGDTITATLDWDRSAPGSAAAAAAAGLPLGPEVKIHPPARTAATQGGRDHRFADRLDRQNGKLIGIALA
jgi:hypothetical protein